ncbi:MAG: hypothetical protein KF802_10310 [Bdellovibrionaceae bacterium]|nr:hypothetical protein [Pseudobdellovibrionaceae bacterium]MBX3033803.1 hypothetical protein [Pseudobdellovibrionaceae bacterium]
MKKAFSLCLLSASLLSCSQKASLKTGSADGPPRDPPQTEITVSKNDLAGGLKSLKGKKVTAFVIFNLPDGYLIRAKAKINPPDFAIREVLDLQNERINWFNEALVVNCDDCPEVEANPPLQVLRENDLLRLIDRVSLNQDPTAADWQVLRKEAPAANFLWLIFASEDYEQKRDSNEKKDHVVARSESEVRLRSFFYDPAARKVRHAAQVRGWDFNETSYPLRKTDWNVPAGGGFDSLQFDSIYSYPVVPDIPPITRKAFLRLTEALNP